MNNLKVIAFDADDTLWVNENYFAETEKKFCALLEAFDSHHNISKTLLETEVKNLGIYGYGVKGFTLSMIETALNITNNTAPVSTIEIIISLGKDLLHKEIELLPHVVEVLDVLQHKYKIVVATKGDLLDQQNKLERSGLSKYFHHIEVMSDKKEKDYLKLLKHLDIEANEFAMVGNSVKSDILPVLNIGARAFHIPHHTTWAHEVVDVNIKHENFVELKILHQVLSYLV